MSRPGNENLLRQIRAARALHDPMRCIVCKEPPHARPHSNRKLNLSSPIRPKRRVSHYERDLSPARFTIRRISPSVFCHTFPFLSLAMAE